MSSGANALLEVLGRYGIRDADGRDMTPGTVRIYCEGSAAYITVEELRIVPTPDGFSYRCPADDDELASVTSTDGYIYGDWQVWRDGRWQSWSHGFLRIGAISEND